jgi:pyruvate dehydrogenase E2 component (dihydrolipoamide acetyltransferase)/2-oxoglutarate dehydrogenase E2 component (dihydrolipoamide succinyltransferase)
MAVEIVMPKLAMAMKQGKIVQWKANEGDWVEKGQIVMVIETEKVTYEVESPASGFLHVVAEFDKVYPVQETMAQLAENEEELADLQAARPAPAMPEVKKAAAANARVAAAAAPAPADSQNRARIKISPAARNLAQKHNIDAARITGSGPGGRIKKQDVIHFMESGEAVAAAAPAAEAWTGEVIDGKRVKAGVAYTGMRKAIADHMMQSLAVSAQLSNMGEIDVTELVRLRKSYLAKEEEIGVRITYTDIIVMLLAKAIKYVPIVNSSLIDNEIKIWEDINVGVAVTVEAGEYDSGLIVPVVKNTERKSLVEIAKSIRDLTTRARNGQLTPDEVTGGTITLSNMGAFTSGWQVGTPIINQPQSVIIATGSIFEKPVGVNGNIAIRPYMTFSFTFDHRIMDGAPMAKFYSKIIELAGNPEYLLL